MVYEPALPRQFFRWASLVEPSDIARWPSLKRRGRSRPPKPKQGCPRQAVAVGGSRKRNKLLKRYIHLIRDKLLICIGKNKNVFIKACFILYTYRWGARVRWLRQIQPIRWPCLAETPWQLAWPPTGRQPSIRRHPSVVVPGHPSKPRSRWSRVRRLKSNYLSMSIAIESLKSDLST